MESDVSNFAARNIKSTVLHVSELAHAIQAEEVALIGTPSLVPAENVADIYFVRSSIAQRQGRTDISAQFESLAAQCKANAGLDCKLWVFDGSAFSYAAFEIHPSNTVVGCIRFDGSFASGLGDA